MGILIYGLLLSPECFSSLEVVWWCRERRIRVRSGRILGFLSPGTAQPQVSGRKENNSSVRSWIFYIKSLALLRAPALCIPLRRCPFPCSSRLLHHAEEWVSALSLCQNQVSAELPIDSLLTRLSSTKWGLTFGLQYVVCFCFRVFFMCVYVCVLFPEVLSGVKQSCFLHTRTRGWVGPEARLRCACLSPPHGLSLLHRAGIAPALLLQLWEQDRARPARREIPTVMTSNQSFLPLCLVYFLTALTVVHVPPLSLSAAFWHLTAIT